MKSRSILTRRSFLKISAVAGSGLTLGFILEGCEADGSTTDTQAPAALLPTVVPPTAVPESRFTPNAYLAIDSTGAVTIRLHRSEMGQGIRTALPMIVAEELEADWSTIRLEPAPADPAYGDQVTGGSLSIQQSYVPLRRVGATARMMLVAAAAQTWGVAPESCYAAQGFVIHRPSGRKLTYGELAATAATLPVPQDAPLKDAADFRIIGTQPEQLDDTAIVTGRAIYGMDVRVPGLLYATVARCPVFGGHVATFDAAPAKSISGVRDVVQIDSGVAVVADSTWAAIQGRQALTISWEEGPNADLDSAHIRDLLVEQAEKVAGSDNKGSATRFVDAIYELPYLAHAPMEPMNCLAEVRSNGCTIWAPTQDRQAAQFEARRVAGSLPVAVQVPLIGGGFGRRLDVDYVPEAVQLARAVGAPVQVIWTREDDIQHDRYRPTSYHIVRGGLDAQGMPVTWRHINASQGIADLRRKTVRTSIG